MTAHLQAALHRQQAHDRLVLALDDVLGTLHGLGWHDLVLMEALAAQPAPVPLRALAQALAWAPAAVVRRSAPLVKTGWLARDADGIALRAPGRARLAEARETAAVACARHATVMGPA